jgi:predicted  nucleic acid-binding Zn-ribbon protein
MDKPMYFRRCHLCGAVCYRDEHNHIQECEHCGKAWAKFHYFDDRLTPIQSDRTLRPAPHEGEWIAIQGLTVYWESF